MNKKPSDRIRDVYFKYRGRDGDGYEHWVEAICCFLDEQAEKESSEPTCSKEFANLAKIETEKMLHLGHGPENRKRLFDFFDSHTSEE